MIQTKKLKGYWWMPEYPENQIFGTIDYVPNKPIVIELIGLWENAKHTLHDINYHKPINTIWGMTSEGDEITLLEGKIENFKGTYSQWDETSFSFSSILIGCHVSSDDSPVVNSLSICVDYMNKWAKLSGKEYSFNDNFEEITVKFKSIPQIELFNSEEYKISLNPYWRFFYDNKNINEWISLHIDFIHPTSYMEVLDIAQRLKHLYAFSIGRTLGFESIGVKLENGNNKYYPILLSINPSDPLYSCNEDNMIIPFNFIKENSSTFFERWFSLYDNFELMLGYYFDTRYYYKELKNVNKFINLVSALELYARKYKYGKNLRERLTSLAYSFNPVSDYLLDDIDVFVSEVVDTRNHLTHENNSKGQNCIIDTKFLNKHIQKLLVLIQMCISRELGLNNNQITERITRAASNIMCFERANEFCNFIFKFRKENQNTKYE